jgi:hypothetical protein
MLKQKNLKNKKLNMMQHLQEIKLMQQQLKKIELVLEVVVL